MKKSTLIGLSILSVFLLCSLSYNPCIADDNNVIKDVQGREVRAYFFVIGSIYNLTYEEVMIEETLTKIYRFNCTRVSIYYCIPRALFFFREKFNNGEGFSLFELSYNNIHFYHRGFIGENFVCALQVLKNEVE